MNIAIIGDYDMDYLPHPATTQSLGHASSALGIDIKISWIPSEKIRIDSQFPFNRYNGIWLGPGPYKDNRLVNLAIQYIRQINIPFLGTCGGLYQSLTEFGKNVLKLDEKVFEKRGQEHGHYFFLMDSSCGAHGLKVLQFNTVKNTKTSEIYNHSACEEESNCGFVVNPLYFKQLEEHGMMIGGKNGNNEACIFEFKPNRFFILTKYLPQIRSYVRKPHPLVTSFLKAASS